VRILTNFRNSPESIDLPRGGRATLTCAETWPEFRKLLPTCDLVVVDCRDFLIYKLAAYFLVFPWRRLPLVAVDLVLRKPLRLRHRLTAVIKRRLITRIDHFVHYFKDLTGYSRYFGVLPSRSSYVPFKANVSGIHVAETDLREEYIFTLGVSLRDYDTFIRAIAQLPYPAAIPEYSFHNFENRSPSFPWSPNNVPRNLTILPDSGDRQDLLNHMSRARIVVIPIQGISLCASGISTYLDAMYLGKCVITTVGPGASDLLTDQAILVPAHDVSALRDAIRRAWEDDSLRERTARFGREYAVSLGGEAEMLQRIYRRCVEVFCADPVKKL
jgi:glycosyltransferase involved in cell wall biosynthesis